MPEHDQLSNTSLHYRSNSDPLAILDHFELFTEEAFLTMAQSVTSGSPLDPLPCTKWKELGAELFPPLRLICNSSLASGMVPVDWKQAMVTPLLKKATLDPNNASNYRPISLLPFPVKVIERLVSKSLSQFLELNGCLDDMQYGFRPAHGTETALLTVLDDLRWQADRGQSGILILLDLSAAFDTVNHERLLARLRETGIVGMAWEWLRSYLKDRRQAVFLSPFKSAFSNTPCGVPQGSAISPILFNIYLRPLVDIIKSYGVKVVNYADDTQLFFSLEGQQSVTLATFHACMHDIVSWLGANSLQFNSSKTEVLYCTVGRAPAPLPSNFWPLPSPPVSLPVNQVRNLGVLLDANLTLEAHVNKTVGTCFALIRSLRKILPLLPITARAVVTGSLVLSRLDYCNALLLEIPKYLIERLL